jgi:cytochrome c oxidase subunit IV
VSDSSAVATRSAATPAVHDPGDVVAKAEEQAHHHPTPGMYVLVAIVLAVLTAMEVSLNYIEWEQAVEVPLLLVLMTIKFALVGLFFMHLKFDSPVFLRLFLVGLFLAILIYAGALATEHVVL